MNYSEYYLLLIVVLNIFPYNIVMKNRRIFNALPNMTGTDEKIVSYINDHLDIISKMTSSQMAEEVGVSQSTIIKFSQKLGYPTYKRMISDITSDQPDDNLNDELEFNESTTTTMAKLQQAYSDVFAMVSRLNPSMNIEKAANIINGSSSVKIFAHNARENYIGHYFYNELLRIGIQAFASESITEMTAQMALVKPGDVIVILSKSGETREMLNFAKLAKKSNAYVISITRTQKNTLAKLSDVNLKTVEYLNRTFMRERLVTESFLFLLDTIILDIIKLRPELAETQINKIRIYTKPNYVEPD